MSIQPRPMAYGNGTSGVDRAIGDRIRQQRILMGLTQDQVGDALGVSYQQVQKYEAGANRISAGRLYAIAGLLGVRVASLFPDDDRVAGDTDVGSSASTRHVIELVRRFSRIEDHGIRTGIMSLVRSITDAERGRAFPGV